MYVPEACMMTEEMVESTSRKYILLPILRALSSSRYMNADSVREERKKTVVTKSRTLVYTVCTCKNIS